MGNIGTYVEHEELLELRFDIFTVTYRCKNKHIHIKNISQKTDATNYILTFNLLEIPISGGEEKDLIHFFIVSLEYNHL